MWERHLWIVLIKSKKATFDLFATRSQHHNNLYEVLTILGQLGITSIP